MALLPELRRDAARLQPQRTRTIHLAKLVVTNAPFCAVALYRVSHGLHRSGHQGMARFVARVNLGLNGVDIDPRAVIGAGALIQHPVGVVVGAATIGVGATVMGGVTLGRRDVLRGPDEGMYPRLGDHVLLGSGCTLIGPIAVGDGASVGAGAVVLDDVPAGHVAVGTPARVLPRDVTPDRSAGEV